MKALNLLHRARKRFRKSVPRTMVVSRTNIFWETDFTKVYINKEGWVHSLPGPVLEEDKGVSVFKDGKER
ncbi:MAG: hypothetical protein QW292_09820 [Candidatus Parvarchaeota archaeon]